MKKLILFFVFISICKNIFSQNINFVYPIIDSLYPDSYHDLRYVATNPIKFEYCNAVTKKLKCFFSETSLNAMDSLYETNSEVADTFVWDALKVKQVKFISSRQIDSLRGRFNTINEIITNRKVKISIASSNGIIDTFFRLPQRVYYDMKKRKQYENKIINKLLQRQATPTIMHVSYPIILDKDNFILAISKLNISTIYDGGVIFLYRRNLSNQWDRISLLQYGD